MSCYDFAAAAARRPPWQAALDFEADTDSDAAPQASRPGTPLPGARADAVPTAAPQAVDDACRLHDFAFLSVGKDPAHEGDTLFVSATNAAARTFTGDWAWKDVLAAVCGDQDVSPCADQPVPRIVLVFPTGQHLGTAAPLLREELRRWSQPPSACKMSAVILWRITHQGDRKQMADAAAQQPQELAQHVREALGARSTVVSALAKDRGWFMDCQRLLMTRFDSNVASIIARARRRSAAPAAKRRRPAQEAPAELHVVDVSRQEGLPVVPLDPAQHQMAALVAAVSPGAREVALKLLLFLQHVPERNRQSLADMVRMRVAPGPATDACLAAVEGGTGGDVRLLDLVCGAASPSAGATLKSVYDTTRLCAHVMLRISSL